MSPIFDEEPEYTMASLRKKDRGSWLARWRNAEGKLVEQATGEYKREAAQKKANQMEAEAKFWEDAEQFEMYAAIGYSPRYCYESFIASGHMRFNRFRHLLEEANIEFLPPAKWRDQKRKVPTNGKKYLYRGSRLTLREIIDKSGCPLKQATLRYRLDHGWSIEKAIDTPLMSQQDSGRQGANITNSKRARKK
eukprot:Seg16804.2 transcript_id=Seg16804.2/GoldUCD/mRNA.D3Y31 product="hypothetical protein" protein_id=Seg16804.2/GoldUCD/D3Y31